MNISGTIAEAVFIIVMLSWFVFAGVFIFRKKPPPAPEKKRDNGARYGIALEGIGNACVWAVRRPAFTPIFPFGFPVEIVLALMTVAVAISSSLLALAAVRTLGKQWAYAARIVDDHELITQGPYSIVRNPIYTGMFGLMIATGLAISFWWAFPPAIVFFWTGTMMRIRAEEKLLREAFGNEFDAYAGRVPALLPRFGAGTSR